MRKSIAQYISFSKKETIAAVILISIVVPFALLPAITRDASKMAPDADMHAGDADWGSVTEALDGKAQAVPERVYSQSSDYKYRSYKNNYPTVVKGRLFNFDPNTASEAELKELGLRDKTISILYNYRNKGGKFRRAEDLQKIYGLKPQEFERLRPFIVISSAHSGQQAFERKDYANTNQAPTQTKQEWKRKVVAIDINAADTTAFQSLYGIGSKLAARIVNFRNKLGGFYTIDQVGETYGVPEETFQNIKQYLLVDGAAIKKMNANTASYDELNAHPYISSKLAYLIMKYRKENGNISSWENLKELVSQTNDSYEKAINYLTIN